MLMLESDWSFKVQIFSDYLKKNLRKVGEGLLQFQSRLEELKQEEKPLQGLFSEADLWAERTLIQGLASIPELSELLFLAEENAFAFPDRFEKGTNYRPKDFSQKQYYCILDPLDGTTNFLHGLDYFCITLALSYGTHLLCGLTYRPSTQELVEAVFQQGITYYAPIGGEKIPVPFIPRQKNLKTSLWVSGFSCEKQNFIPEEVSILEKLLPKISGVRRFGSAGLDLAYTALGRFDGMWEKGLAPWDMAAGILMAKEAGLICCELFETSRMVDFFTSEILVSTQKLADDFVREIRK